VIITVQEWPKEDGPSRDTSAPDQKLAPKFGIGDGIETDMDDPQRQVLSLSFLDGFSSVRFGRSLTLPSLLNLGKELGRFTRYLLNCHFCLLSRRRQFDGGKIEFGGFNVLKNIALWIATHIDRMVVAVKLKTPTVCG